MEEPYISNIYVIAIIHEQIIHPKVLQPSLITVGALLPHGIDRSPQQKNYAS